MKSKTISVIFLNLLFGIVTLSCTQNEVMWKGTINEEDGVTIIENTGLGLWGKEASEKIQFKENLSLGVEEGDEDLMFYRSINLAIDNNNHRKYLN